MLCPYNDAQHDEVHVLNDTAKVVWEGLAAGWTEEEIAAVLRAKFAVADGDEVLADVRALMTTFRAKANPPIPPLPKGGWGDFRQTKG